MYFIHLVMNSAREQLQLDECRLQNTMMHSKHLENFTEDAVTMVEDTVSRISDYQCANVMFTYVKSSHRQEIGTAVNMEDGRGRLQVRYISLRDCSEMTEVGGVNKGEGYIYTYILNEYDIPDLFFTPLLSCIVYCKNNKNSN